MTADPTNRRPHPRRTALFLSIALTLCGSSLEAQDRTALTLQREARRQYELLRERLQRLSSTDGQDRAVLESGNRFLQDRAISEQMSEIESLIEAARYDEALRRMQALRTELTGLLDLLLGRDQEVSDLGAEIERLQDYRRRVRELKEAQQEETERAERSAALASLKQQIEQALTELREIQGSTRSVIGSLTNATDLTSVAESQGQIVTRANDLEPRVRRIQKSARALDLLDPTDEVLLSTAQAITTRCRAALVAIPSAAGRATEALNGALGDAHNLTTRLSALLELVEREANTDSLQDQREDQAATAEATRELAEEMQEDEARAAEAGENRHTPGREDLEQAIPEQQDALDELEQNRAQSASQEQREALEKLENAEQQLEEALDQLEQQRQEEILRNLEAEFTEMLNQQRDLTKRTRSAFELAQTFDGELPKALTQRALDLSVGEQGLESRAQEALDVLREDGSSTALPQLVELIRSDLADLVTRLSTTPTTSSVFGASTQQRQEEIEATLEDLVGALRQELEDDESGEPSESEGEPELLPRTAELKLILIQQKRINRSTKQLDDDGTSAGEDETTRLATRQSQVAQLLQEIAAKLEAEQREREEQLRQGGGR